jgi:hypothetical protein
MVLLHGRRRKPKPALQAGAGSPCRPCLQLQRAQRNDDHRISRACAQLPPARLPALIGSGALRPGWGGGGGGGARPGGARPPNTTKPPPAPPPPTPPPAPRPPPAPPPPPHLGRARREQLKARRLCRTIHDPSPCVRCMHAYERTDIEPMSSCGRGVLGQSCFDSRGRAPTDR